MSHLVSRSGPVLAARERQAIIKRVVDEALGLGILEPLLNDHSITEIMVNGPDDIYVERRGRLERLTLSFSSDDQLMQMIDRHRRRESIGASTRPRPWSTRAWPPVSASTSSSRRWRWTDPHSRSVGSPPRSRWTTCSAQGNASTLCRATAGRRACALASTSWCPEVRAPARRRCSTPCRGSIPDDDRIVTIEDSAELQLQQPHVIRLESRPANVEGRGQVTIRDLVRNSLRMRPDRIIVGEVRGGETLDMLQAMNTGHDGSLVTVHANNTRRRRLASGDPGLHERAADPRTQALRDQINSAVDLIVQLSRGADGTRAGSPRSPRSRRAAGRSSSWSASWSSTRIRSLRTDA